MNISAARSSASISPPARSKPCSTKCGEHPLKGPNDLVFDRHGGLWFTDLGKRRARDMDVGGFYYIKPGCKEIVEGVFGMMPVNGIGLSPDENTVYVVETPTARLWAFDLSAPGRSSRAT